MMNKKELFPHFGKMLKFLLFASLFLALISQETSATSGNSGSLNRAKVIINNMIDCIEQESATATDPNGSNIANSCKEDCYKKALLKVIGDLVGEASYFEEENKRLSSENQALSQKVNECQLELNSEKNRTQHLNSTLQIILQENIVIGREYQKLSDQLDALENQVETQTATPSPEEKLSELELEIKNFMLGNKTNLNEVDKDGLNVLHKLLSGWKSLSPEKFHEIVEYFVSKNSTHLFNNQCNYLPVYFPGFWVTQKSTPFLLAVKNVEIQEKTLVLLKNNGVDFNGTNEKEINCLAYAILGNRSIEFMNELVKLGANWKHLSVGNNSLLNYAARFGTVHQIMYLFALGLDINAGNHINWTPLNWAALNTNGNMLEMVKYILDQGGILKTKPWNDELKSKIEQAIVNGDAKEVTRLTELKYNPKTRKLE